MDEVIIIGGGITGLTLALGLHRLGISSRVFEGAREIRKLGVGINILPHGMRELTELGLGDELENAAVLTREMCFYNRFGQLIYKEPRGRYAGYTWPQLSIHRGDLHRVQIAAVRERLGADSIMLGHRCTGVEQDADGVTVHFADREPVRGRIAVGCDGVHSTLRKQLYPREGPPVFKGINMWRGVTRWKPFLSGASMVQVGWLDVGKIVVYPIERVPGEDGLQLINWAAEIRTPRSAMADWNLDGRLEDFYPTFAGFRFDWLDIAGMLERAHVVLEYPMVDRDPLPRWTAGRITLVGDAAHPMYPRGGNGAGQGILDASALAGCLSRDHDWVAALKAYEDVRLKPANDVVLMNRNAPPDTILRIVHERTGDRPFRRIEDVVGEEELVSLSETYKRVAGFERDSLQRRSPFTRKGSSG